MAQRGQLCLDGPQAAALASLGIASGKAADLEARRNLDGEKTPPATAGIQLSGY
jgi:hypothetical protein